MLRPGDVVILDGDLGAGKTCLVQGAAAAFGVTETVNSPSFVLVKSYDARVRIVHADVYRLTTLGELFDLGFDDLLDPRAVTFIEWGEAVAEELPPDAVHIAITDDAEGRIIAIRPGSERIRAVETVVGALT